MMRNQFEGDRHNTPIGFPIQHPQRVQSDDRNGRFFGILPSRTTHIGEIMAKKPRISDKILYKQSFL